jgi:hypothetical protein
MHQGVRHETCGRKSFRAAMPWMHAASLFAAIALAVPALSDDAAPGPEGARRTGTQAAIVDGHRIQPTPKEDRSPQGADLTSKEAKEVDELARELLSVPPATTRERVPEIIGH